MQSAIYFISICFCIFIGNAFFSWLVVFTLFSLSFFGWFLYFVRLGKRWWVTVWLAVCVDVSKMVLLTFSKTKWMKTNNCMERWAIDGKLTNGMRLNWRREATRMANCHLLFEFGRLLRSGFYWWWWYWVDIYLYLRGYLVNKEVAEGGWAMQFCYCCLFLWCIYELFAEINLIILEGFRLVFSACLLLMMAFNES